MWTWSKCLFSQLENNFTARDEGDDECLSSSLLTGDEFGDYMGDWRREHEKRRHIWGKQNPRLSHGTSLQEEHVTLITTFTQPWDLTPFHIPSSKKPHAQLYEIFIQYVHFLLFFSYLCLSLKQLPPKRGETRRQWERETVFCRTISFLPGSPTVTC